MTLSGQAIHHTDSFRGGVARSSATPSSSTGTITNDDIAAAASAGSYKGATQEGNFVFFNVGADRTVSGFRANDISENCRGGGTLSGSVS